jgi:isopentenyl diphosphate isomerase/L-lactate dehydrogenase-like FMN-dependent dehydrogenase
MVGIGKLQMLALGAAGEQGVARMLEILELEITTAMKLLGVNKLTELDGTYMQPATPVTAPGALSALPLL